MQTCSVCKEKKPFTDYYKHKTYHTGYSVTCKICSSKRSSEWQKANRKLLNERARNKYRENIEVNAKYNREKRMRWYSSSEENKKIAKENAIKWSKNNPKKVLLKNHVRRVKLKGNGVFKIIPKDLNKILSSPCNNCGKIDGITMDHIIPISRGGRHSVGNLQGLCKSCNSSKGKRTIMEWRIAG